MLAMKMCISVLKGVKMKGANKKFKVFTSYCLNVEADSYEEAEMKAEQSILQLEGLGGDWCWCEDLDVICDDNFQ